MSHHDRSKYPEYNTSSIRAELVMYGLRIYTPCQAADCLRFGYVAARKHKSRPVLIRELEEYINMDLSNAGAAKAVRKELIQQQKASELLEDTQTSYTSQELLALMSSEWRHMDEAPRDRLIRVFVAAKHGLSAFITVVQWHESAGFCVDQLREAVMWTDID